MDHRPFKVTICHMQDKYQLDCLTYKSNHLIARKGLWCHWKLKT